MQFVTLTANIMSCTEFTLCSVHALKAVLDRQLSFLCSEMHFFTDFTLWTTGLSLCVSLELLQHGCICHPYFSFVVCLSETFPTHGEASQMWNPVSWGGFYLHFSKLKLTLSFSAHCCLWLCHCSFSALTGAHNSFWLSIVCKLHQSIITIRRKGRAIKGF